MVSLYNCTDATSANNEEEVTPLFQYTATVIILGTTAPTRDAESFQKTIPPAGMAYVPGGNIHLGSEQGYENEKPRVWASVQPFFMDETEVTVAAFREFIKATGYKTEADKFGNSGVFFNDESNWWRMKDGANWEYPQGKDQEKAKDAHPVTQVSWNDAVAYATWAGKRLPSEIEWEHAARNANNSEQKYSWGEDAKVDGRWKLNFFQGNFPKENINEDGFVYTAPVGSFGKSVLGLSDMSGNVWEWCSDNKISYQDLALGNFNKANKLEKVMRGGSFLCETTLCHGYRVSSRSFTTPETSLMHIGFRCVKDVNQ